MPSKQGNTGADGEQGGQSNLNEPRSHERRERKGKRLGPQGGRNVRSRVEGESVNWAMDSPIRDILLEGIDAPERMRIKEFVQHHLGVVLPEETPNCTMEAFISNPKSYINDANLLSDIQALPDYKTLQDIQTLWGQGVVFLKEYIQLEERPPLSERSMGMLASALKSSNPEKFDTPEELFNFYRFKGEDRDVTKPRTSLHGILRELGKKESDSGEFIFNIPQACSKVAEVVEKIFSRQPGDDKSRIPLPCVIGCSGQGKTELLQLLRENATVPLKEEVQDNVVSTLETGRFLDAVVKRQYKNGNANIEEAQRPIALFSTFSRDSSFSIDEPPSAALINRLMADMTNKVTMENWSKAIDFNLKCFFDFLRKQYPESVAIFVLVDELRKIKDENQRRSLVREICGALSHSVNRELRIIPIVSCLDVAFLHETVSTGSYRPLYNIPILPCRPQDMRKVSDALCEHFKSQKLFKKDEERSLFAIKSAIYNSGGHFRIMERIAGRVKEHINKSKCISSKQFQNEVFTFDGDIDSYLQVLSKHMFYPNEQWKETELIGKKTLFELASRRDSALIYREVFRNSNVELTMPTGPLFQWSTAGKDSSLSKKIESIRKAVEELKSNLTEGVNDGNKAMEKVIPAAERAVSLFWDFYCNNLGKESGEKRLSFVDLFKESKCDFDDECGVYAKFYGSPSRHTLADLLVNVELVKKGLGERYQPQKTKTRKGLDKAIRNIEHENLHVVYPEVKNYPALYGAHNMLMLQTEGSGEAEPICVGLQMKVTKELNTPLKTIAKRAHERMKECRVHDPKPYVMIYATGIAEVKVKKQMKGLPNGTIIVTNKGIRGLLMKFGMTWLLEEVEKRRRK